MMDTHNKPVDTKAPAVKTGDAIAVKEVTPVVAAKDANTVKTEAK